MPKSSMKCSEGDYDPLPDIPGFLHQFHPDKELKSITLNSDQGFASLTYLIEFLASPSIILQFRFDGRSIPPEVLEGKHHAHLGSLVPSVKLLANVKPDVELYELSVIPGIPLHAALRIASHECLVSIASSIGDYLGRCIVRDMRAGDHKDEWYPLMEKCLRSAVVNEDPRVVGRRETFQELLDAFLDGQLDDLPLSMTNWDFGYLNVLIEIDEGRMGGMVDWESLGYVPFGCELIAVFFLLGVGDDTDVGYHLRDDYVEIEKAFWIAVQKYVRREEAMAIQLAFRIRIVMGVTAHGGFQRFASPAPYETVLDYDIPWDFVFPVHRFLSGSDSPTIL